MGDMIYECPQMQNQNITSWWKCPKHWIQKHTPFAAIHVRRTDKSKEADHIQISEYMDYVRDYFDILNAQGLEMKTKKVVYKYFVVSIH